MTLESSEFSQQIIKRDLLNLEYCYIPQGRFMRGPNRQPEIIQAPFYIGRFPVTKDLFLRFIADTNYDYSPLHRKIMDKLAPEPECPATPVSWWDAKYFIRWLRQVTGEYYSLPMEIEWEMAARGPNGIRYPWGEREPTDLHACLSLTKLRECTDVVGTHPLGNSPFGCADMAGNVWEWCLDQIDEENEIHVLRGGSAQDGPESCTTFSRTFSSPPTLRVNFAGFRVIYLPGQMFEQYCQAYAH
ncbi:MAG: formylglycine-generating enzyme family protein [Lentisphaerae bacterium]|nr:MAG: formylglycine-generating enzyme family protein [Lentisphaerota bacterium]